MTGPIVINRLSNGISVQIGLKSGIILDCFFVMV
jgi:hypothetical protein